MKLQGYAEVTWFERLGLLVAIATLPLYIGARVLLSPLTHDKRKSVHQIVAQSTLRHLFSNMSFCQLQWLHGTDASAYGNFLNSKQGEIEACVEDLRDGAQLMWIGPKRTDKVLLYIHGGGYITPLLPPYFCFLDHIRQDFDQKGMSVGVVALSYNLIPIARFPSQLIEIKAAIESLFASGARSEDIILMGDSAGGNLILQVISHLLRPLHSVDSFSVGPKIRFAGACLISPWVSLDGKDKTFVTNTNNDIFSGSVVHYWGTHVLSSVPPSDIPFANPAKAEEGWFEGLLAVVSRILVIGGEREVLFGPIVDLVERHLQKVHGDVVFMRQDEGVHDQMLLEFDGNERKRKRSRGEEEFYRQVLDWVVQTFANI